MTFIFTGFMVLLFSIGIPVAFSLGITGLVAFIAEQGTRINLAIMTQRMMYGINNFVLLAIPLFILAAKLMNTAGITKRLFDFANHLVGYLPGGLGHANVVASLIFSGMSGSAVSDAAGLGTIEMKAMLDAGYDRDFSAAITASSSTIGPIFPPSIPFVIFGVASGVSVGKLFLGGVIPGVLMALALMVMITIYAHRKGYPRMESFSLRMIGRSFKGAFLPLLTPVILLGGIWTGYFTPTEASAVAVAYAIILGLFVYREISLRELGAIFVNTMKETAALGFIICAGSFYGWLLMRSGIPIRFAETIAGVSQNPYMILFLISLFLLVVGCFIETVVAILILTPIFVPIIDKVGIDPVHFGLIMVLNLMIGLLTPPFGVVLFVLVKVANIPFGRLVRATLPFLIPLLAVLFLITVFPPLVTMLPNLLMPK